MFDLPKYGDGICLARLDALLAALGIDRKRLQQRSIVVTGSNGKGSTAAFCASIGGAFGLRTGLFTSPHLYRFNERFQVDGVEIDSPRLSVLVARIMGAIGAMAAERFGAFEAQFALACLYFQEADCSLMVFEAGIGGRFDPVRLIGAQTTCVASVDLEHTALLGPSLEAIVADKSDACAAGGTIVYGENCRAMKAHLAAYNRARCVSALFVREQVAISNESAQSSGQRFDLAIGPMQLASLEIALAGGFQINNAAIATALFALWLRREHPAVRVSAIESAIRTGLRTTRWPGRLDVISRDPLTVIDVGHTPDGVTQALAGLFAAHSRHDWLLVLGASMDKDVSVIAARLAPAFDHVICTAAHHKGADAKAMAAAARNANALAEIQVSLTIEEAVAHSRAMALASGSRIYVAGGLFVAIEYAQISQGGKAEDLRFF